MGNAATAGAEAERFRVGPGDRIVVTEMEHHANLVPVAAARRSAPAPSWPGSRSTDEGRLDLDRPRASHRRPHQGGRVRAPEQHPRHASTRSTPSRRGPVPSVRSSCSTPVSPSPTCRSRFRDLDVDFVAFSGHKMLGPSGIGVLVGSPAAARAPASVPHRRLDDRAGLHGPQHVRAAAAAVRGRNAADLAGGRALPQPCEYLTTLGMQRGARRTSTRLTEPTLLERLRRAAAGSGSIGPPRPRDRGGAVSFAVDGIHPHDVGQVLDDRGVAVRVGHHCAWPVCRRYGVPATTRASFYVYNDTADLDALVEGIVAAQAVLRGAPREARADVPGDHPRPLPLPAEPGTAGAVRGRGPPRQPDLW